MSLALVKSILTRVGPDLGYFAGCRISDRIIRHALPDFAGYLAFSCRISGQIILHCRISGPTLVTTYGMKKKQNDNVCIWLFSILNYHICWFCVKMYIFTQYIHSIHFDRNHVEMEIENVGKISVFDHCSHIRPIFGFNIKSRYRTSSLKGEQKNFKKWYLCI